MASSTRRVLLLLKTHKAPGAICARALYFAYKLKRTRAPLESEGRGPGKESAATLKGEVWKRGQRAPAAARGFAVLAMVALVRPPSPPIFARISYNDAYIPPPWPAAAPFGQRHARPAEHKTTLYNMRSGGRTAAGLCWFRAARPRHCWPRFGLRSFSARVNAARSFLPFSPARAFRCAAAACAGDARTRPLRRRPLLALFFLPGPREARRIKGLQPARRPPCDDRSRFHV